ncbi:MAG: DUF4230 domain-containing protein [Lawsonibacter sp.]|nr:DUF4230 domain-containing protein [Lawsonibacter sp.]
MAETKKSEPKLWQKKWFPWALAGVLLLVVGLAGWSSLSARTRQKELEAELQLQRETIEALRAQAGQEEDEGLIHEALPVITDSLISEQLNALRELVTTEYLYTNSGKYENQNQITIIGKDINIPFTGKRFIVAYDGRIQAGVDIGQTQIDIDEDARAITITLPKSEIVSHETFEDTLVVLDETNNVFNPISIENYNEFVSEQKDGMEKKAIERGLLTNADAEAKRMVQSFLSQIPGIDTYQLTIQQGA